MLDSRERLSPEEIKDQILRANEQASKSFEFSNSHDPRKPAQWWFQESDEGLVLFIVLYTLACRWARCTSCNLPSLSATHHIGFRPMIDQINLLFSDPEISERRKDINKIILSNNGSVLDEATFPTTTLMYFMVKVNLLFPNLSVLCLETRVEYVDVAELEFLKRAIEEGDTSADLELAIGFEAFDDKIRNKFFQKGLSLREFEELVQKIQPFGFHLKCYIMQKPVVEMNDAEAIADIRNAIAYLGAVADRYGARLNLHLNPTYVARGTLLEEAFQQGEYMPPRLVDVARATLHAKDQPVSVFIGLSDEGLAVPGGSFIREEDGPVVERMEEFNRTQDYLILSSIIEEGSD